MPFEQKYTPQTRDSALARIVERRATEPGNRSIIRETAEEFEVGEQSLRGWIRAYEKANAPDAPVEPEVVAEPAPTPVAAVAAITEAPTRRAARVAPPAPVADTRITDLEAEVAKLRRDREALKSALAVLLSE